MAQAAAFGFLKPKPEPWAVTSPSDSLWQLRLPTARARHGRLQALSLSRHNTNYRSYCKRKSANWHFNFQLQEFQKSQEYLYGKLQSFFHSLCRPTPSWWASSTSLRLWRDYLSYWTQSWRRRRNAWVCSWKRKCNNMYPMLTGTFMGL